MKLSYKEWELFVGVGGDGDGAGARRRTCADTTEWGSMRENVWGRRWIGRRHPHLRMFHGSISLG